MEIENVDDGGETVTTTSRCWPSKPYGESIRKMKALQPGPDYLYLIYIRMETSKLVVRHVYGVIDHRNIDVEEDGFIKDAMDGRYQQSDFIRPIVFTGPSYFTIVLDEEGWDFYYPLSSLEDLNLTRLHDPIIFLEDKAENVRSSAGGPVEIVKSYVENWSFYSLKLIEKKIKNSYRKAIRCTNHFTDKNGRPPMEDQAFNYGFNINILVPYSQTTSEKLILTIDPDGQNQGPITFLEKGEKRR